MSFSSLLQIALIAENQSNKYITHNDAIAALEQAANSIYKDTTTVATDANISVSNMTRYTLFKFSGSTGARNVVYPSTTDATPTNTQRKIWFWNATAFTHTLKASTGTGTQITVKAGHIVSFYIDHEDLVLLNDLSTSDPLGIFDIGFYIYGLPPDATSVMRFNCVRSFQLPAAFAGSVGNARVAPTADATFTVKKNGTSIGTVKFTATTGVVVLTAATATSFVSGDILEIVSPSPQDASLADVGFTLKGTRQ